MKKITLLLLLTLSVLGVQAQTYQLNYDSIRVGKTAGTGGTSLYGKVYLKNVGLGLVSDSILTVLNGRIRKIPISGITVDSTIYRTVANSVSLAGLQTRLNAYLLLTGGTLSGGLSGTSASFSGQITSTYNGASALFLNSSGNTNVQYFDLLNTGGRFFLGNNSSVGGTLGTNTSAYSTVLMAVGATPLEFGTNGIKGYTMDASRNNTWTGTLTAPSATLSGASQTLLLGGSGASALWTRFLSTGADSFIGVEGSAGGTITAGSVANSMQLRSSIGIGFSGNAGGSVGMYLNGSNALNLSSLSGTGTRMVVADPSGNISTQSIPGGGGGALTGVVVASANGLGGSSDGATVVPTLTLTTSVNGMVKGNATAFSAATAGTDYTSPTGTENLSNKTITSSTISGYLPLSAGSSNRITDDVYTSNGQFIYGRNLSNSVDIALIGTSTLDKVYIDPSAYGTLFGGSVTASSFIGNASTATALQTPRTIQGVSFDGTANINPINGTGFVKATGTTLSYDNSTYLTGNQSITLSGAVTGSGTTGITTTLASGIDATKIADGTVTSAEFQYINTLSSNAQTQLNSKAPVASPTFTGTVSGITAAMVGAPSGSGTSTGTNTGDQNLAPYATLASPALTGNPTAPTQTAGDNSTKLATTAYVDGAITTSGILNKGVVTFSGNGSTTDFNTGIQGTRFIVTPASADAAALYYVNSQTGCGGLCDELHIIFTTAPASGTNNISFNYIGY